MVSKGTKVKIGASIMHIPDGDGIEQPVLMDRQFMDELMNYISEKKLKMIHCKIEGSNVILEFVNLRLSFQLPLSQFPSFLFVPY